MFSYARARLSAETEEGPTFRAKQESVVLHSPLMAAERRPLYVELDMNQKLSSEEAGMEVRCMAVTQVLRENLTYPVGVGRTTNATP